MSFRNPCNVVYKDLYGLWKCNHFVIRIIVLNDNSYKVHFLFELLSLLQLLPNICFVLFIGFLIINFLFIFFVPAFGGKFHLVTSLCLN